MIKNLGWSAEEQIHKLTTGALPGQAAWKPMTPAYRAALLAEIADPAAMPAIPDVPETDSDKGAGGYAGSAGGYAGSASGYASGDGNNDGGKADSGWREAAVLILLFPETSLPNPTGQLYFPLIVRTEDGGVHSGQLSLPGGALEAGEGPEEAALRECHEELGIPTGQIRVLRRLTRLPVPPSRYIITPVLAVASLRPAYQPSTFEVQQVLDCPLNLLHDPTVLHIAEREYQGSMYPVPCYVLQGHEIWGATAMILAELAALAAPPEHNNGGGAQRVNP